MSEWHLMLDKNDLPPDMGTYWVQTHGGLVELVLWAPDLNDAYAQMPHDAIAWQRIVRPEPLDRSYTENLAELEELKDHARRNNIKGHSIDADGHCNMGCC